MKPRHFRLWILLGCLLGVGANPLSANDGWTALFNGRDLSGWVQRGGKGKYTVEDGVLVGTAADNRENTFLCTERAYGDFILELEFLCDPVMNSGVQVRSECFDKPAKVALETGATITIPANRVHGYQVEIDVNDKSNRWWQGGIYDEARRLWLYPGIRGGDGKKFGDTGREINRAGEWNKLRVIASGDVIQTFINDTPRASIRDDMTLSGFIALQVHAVGENHFGTQVKFRNIRIKTGAVGPDRTVLPEINNYLTQKERAAGWKLLWDGRSGDGWRSAKGEKFPDKGWTRQDGILTVTGKGGGDIITKKAYKDFELVCDFRMTKGANSGIKYLVQTTEDRKNIRPAFEYQILDDAVHPDAKRGRDGNRTLSSLYDILTASTAKAPNPIGEWNTARLLVRGNAVEHWLNGKKVLEFRRDTDAFKKAVQGSKFKNEKDFGSWTEGVILLQDHNDPVSFRNIKIREL